MGCCPDCEARKGAVTFKGAPLTLLGSPVAVGQKAPDFKVLTNDLREVALADYAGRTLVITAVPSLDTGVCDAMTRRFNEEAVKRPGVTVLALSMDLPFAQARWCGAAGVKNVVTLSDHRDGSFGVAWGVLIRELRLLARAVFVVGPDGVVRYAQVVPEMTDHPDYAAALRCV